MRHIPTIAIFFMYFDYPLEQGLRHTMTNFGSLFESILIIH